MQGDIVTCIEVRSSDQVVFSKLTKGVQLIGHKFALVSKLHLFCHNRHDHVISLRLDPCCY